MRLLAESGAIYLSSMKGEDPENPNEQIYGGASLLLHVDESIADPNITIGIASFSS